MSAKKFAIAFFNNETKAVVFYTGKETGRHLSPNVYDAVFAYTADEVTAIGTNMINTIPTMKNMVAFPW